MFPKLYLTRKSLFLLLIIGITTLCTLSSSVVKANASEQWQRIRTPHYDILFLSNIAREAQRMANTLEALYVPVSKTLHVSPKRIPMILRSQIAISNGFAIIPPRRVECFTFPTQDYNLLHVNDWLNLLAVHELRHVAQFESIIQNLSWATPPWLLEGDAVGIETALSKGGRGRAPYFEVLYKINLLERGGFSYYKQMYGSLRNQIPDHYRLGYFMATHLRRKYGADIINKLLQRDGFLETINPFALYPRCKKLTGRTLTEIYQDTNEELKTLWASQLKGLKITPIRSIHNRIADEYIDYSYPQPTEEGGIMVLKSGIGTPTQFVRINEKRQEDRIFTPASIQPSTKFSIAKDKIVWIGNTPSLSSPYQSYTAIQSYNFHTRRFKTLVRTSRYSSVALSPAGTRLIASETDESYNHRLVILDAENGNVLHTFPNPENYYYLTPTWAADGSHIVAIKHANSKASIVVINSQTNTSEDILPYTDELIGCPILHEGYIYYNSAYSGIDNIYAINLTTKQQFQVTSSKYGAYNPALSTDGKWLLYNDFSKDGMNAVRIPLDTRLWTPIEKVEDRSIRYYEPLIVQENNAGILTHIPDSTYQIEPYKLWKNLSLDFTPICRRPYQYIKPEDGIALTLQDILGTTEWALIGITGRLAFTGNNLCIDRLFTSLTYKKRYPIINIEGSLTGIALPTKQEPSKIEKEINIDLEVPFNWNFGQYMYEITLNTTTQFKTVNALNNKWICRQHYTSLFSRNSTRSSRDLYSSWGQKLLLTYTHTPYGFSLAHVGGAKLKLHFPGLHTHHSLRIGITQQYKSRESSVIANFPINIRRQSKSSNYNKPHSISIDYAFPIAYPDYELWRDLIIKRLKANLFYDWTYHLARRHDLHTIGTDFTIDLPGIYIGLRCMYKIDANKTHYGVLIGLNF